MFGTTADYVNEQDKKNVGAKNLSPRHACKGESDQFRKMPRSRPVERSRKSATERSPSLPIVTTKGQRPRITTLRDML